MKKIISLLVGITLMLAGCGGGNNELSTAIYNSENMNTGVINADFTYKSDFGNVEVGGDVTGNVNLTYGETFDKVSGNITLNENVDDFTYYINDDNVYSVDEDGNKVVETVTPFFHQTLDINELVTTIPEPTVEDIEIGDTTVTTNVYTIGIENKISGEQAAALFDVVVKLGLVSSEVLSTDSIPGNITLVFYVDQQTGNLVKEVASYTNADVEDATSVTTIEATTTFDYQPATFEVPSQITEE